MKILKNFDAKKIAKAKNKILLAIVFILFLVLLVLSSAFREFVSKHPGLIGVLIAVSGEVYFDWKEESGGHAKWKKFFMALLVVSLAYELYEASESDQKAADSIKLAGQANLQVGVLSNETVRLAMNLEGDKSNNLELARQVFGLAAQTEQISTSIAQVRDMASSPEITAKLNEANKSLAEATATISDVKNVLKNSNLAGLKIASADRTITLEQEKNLIAILKPFTKTNFMFDNSVRVNVNMEDFESDSYARKIVNVLKECGFDAKLDEGLFWKSKDIPQPVGLKLFVENEFRIPERPILKEAVMILMAFRRENLIPKNGLLIPSTNSVAGLVIVVGHKPE